jgi:hypothetical protein
MDITSEPVRPALPASPVERETIPEAPLLVVPVVKDRNPLVPKTPEFTVLIMTEPVEVTWLNPVCNEIEPPVVSGVSPALTWIFAPVPTSFVPPLSLIALWRPPVFSVKDPAEPELVVPDVNVISPLIPAVPAFRVLKMTDPVLVKVPAPPAREIVPPVKLAPCPASNFRKPPIAAVALLAKPALKDTLPPRTVFAVLSPAVRMKLPPANVLPEDTERRISPPLPLVAAPVVNPILPLAPVLVVPLVNDR